MNSEEHNAHKSKSYVSQSAEDRRTKSYGKQTDSCTDLTSTHNLGVGDTVSLNQTEYRIDRIISGEKKSGEAVIFKIKKERHDFRHAVFRILFYIN